MSRLDFNHLLRTGKEPEEPEMPECEVCNGKLSTNDNGTNSEPTECSICLGYVHFECGTNQNWGFICNNCRKWD